LPRARLLVLVISRKTSRAKPVLLPERSDKLLKWLVDNRTIKYNQMIARDCDELRCRRTLFGWDEHYRFLSIVQPVDKRTNRRLTLTGGNSLILAPRKSRR
jgi:hypothetical protein